MPLAHDKTPESAQIHLVLDPSWTLIFRCRWQLNHWTGNRSAPVRTLNSGHWPTYRDFHEKAGRCQVVWVVHNLLFFSCPDSCMVLAGEDRGQDRAFWARRDSGRSIAESLDGGRSRPY